MIKTGLDLLLELNFYDNLLLKLGCLQPPSHTGTRQKLFWLLYKWLLGSANLYLTCNLKNPVVNAGLHILLQDNYKQYTFTQSIISPLTLQLAVSSSGKGQNIFAVCLYILLGLLSFIISKPCIKHVGVAGQFWMASYGNGC